MADDVRIATGLRKHRKTKRLRRALGGDGCWGLICLFLWAGEERWTGDLSGLSDADLEEEADWEGKPGALIASLVSVGFLHGEEGKRQINDWHEHNPYAASKGARIEKGKNAAAARWDKERKKQAGAPNEDAPSMPGACPEHATRTGEQCPPAPAPAPTPSLDTSNSTDTPVEPAAPVDAGAGYSGAFEGHEVVPASTPNPVARFAIALSRAGFQCTPLNPDLCAFVKEGGTVEDLTAFAALNECRGKPATYVIRYARRELAAAPAAIQQGSTHETRHRLSAPERVEQAIRDRIAHETDVGNVLDGQYVRHDR